MISVIPMPVWNRISVISSVIGVSSDPLFFYVPFIDDDNKCIGVDKKLRIAALILRSLTDITSVVYILHHIRKALKHVESESTRRNSNRFNKFFQEFSIKKFSIYFMFHIFIVLPIPQVRLCDYYWTSDRAMILIISLFNV